MRGAEPFKPASISVQPASPLTANTLTNKMRSPTTPVAIASRGVVSSWGTSILSIHASAREASLQGLFLSQGFDWLNAEPASCRSERCKQPDRYDQRDHDR